jgi:arylformamidase
MRTDTGFAEREYNARAAIPEHPQIFARWAETGALTRRRCACMIDLPYGESSGERLDYFPTRRDDAPLFIFIHGGYWRSLDKFDFSWVAPPFVQHGIAVALLNYGLAPATTVEDIVRQQLKAIAWIYRNSDKLRVDPERIVIAGHSAGAHLTAMMMAARWPAYGSDLPADLVKGALVISGLFDLEPLIDASFVNVDLDLDVSRAQRLSPARMPPATAAPLVTAVGVQESNEFKRQTRLLAHAWKDNLRAALTLPGTNHLTVCDAVADPDSPLHQAALQLVHDSRR